MMGQGRSLKIKRIDAAGSLSSVLAVWFAWQHDFTYREWLFTALVFGSLLLLFSWLEAVVAESHRSKTCWSCGVKVST